MIQPGLLAKFRDTSVRSIGQQAFRDTNTNTPVGISAALFVPLIILALYVNEILSASRKYWGKARKSFLASKASKRPKKLHEDDSDEKTDEGEDHDSDKESGTDGDSVDESTSSDDSESEDAEAREYAQLFGKFTFHTHIPVARHLWRYDLYVQKDYIVEDDFTWTIRKDYPLHHYLSKIAHSNTVRKVLRYLSIRLKHRFDSDSDSDSNSDIWTIERGQARPTDANSVSSTEPTPLDMPEMLVRPDGSSTEPAENLAPTFSFGDIRNAIMRRRAHARNPDIV